MVMEGPPITARETWQVRSIRPARRRAASKSDSILPGNETSPQDSRLQEIADKPGACDAEETQDGGYHGFAFEALNGQGQSFG